jgi:hypothetical protein
MRVVHVPREGCDRCIRARYGRVNRPDCPPRARWQEPDFLALGEMLGVAAGQLGLERRVAHG